VRKTHPKKGKYMTEIEIEKRSKLIDGLRELASFLEDHPELPTPWPPTSFLIPAAVTPEIFEAQARVLGTAKKVVTDNYMSMIRSFGPLALEAYASRETVCVRKVVGKKIVPAFNIAEHEVDIVEWDCKPILTGVATPATEGSII
jgi:hypothetical protein